MTHNTQLSFEFKAVSGKAGVADFTSGDVSSDGGVLVLKEIAERLGIIDQHADAIRDTRHQRNVRHGSKNHFSQRIFQIACGCDDADDSDDLRIDPSFKAACDRLPSVDDLASQPTMSRMVQSDS